MHQLQGLAAAGENNIIQIFSNRGAYRFSKAEGTSSSQCSHSLQGTLIEWDLAIGKKQGRGP